MFHTGRPSWSKCFINEEVNSPSSMLSGTTVDNAANVRKVMGNIFSLEMSLVLQAYSQLDLRM